MSRYKQNHQQTINSCDIFTCPTGQEETMGFFKKIAQVFSPKQIVALVPYGVLREAQEILMQLGRAQVLFKKTLEIFSKGDQENVEKGGRRQNYCAERGCRRTFDYIMAVPQWHLEATKRNLRHNIALLVKFEGLSDTEIMGLVMLMDQVQYTWSIGMMFYPRTPKRCWEWSVSKKELPMIVNTLVKEYGGDPYELERTLMAEFEKPELLDQAMGWK